ncbi:MAG: sulfite exporter TauE/SafE family protein [Actinomycetia bacterium]|nr:sulfite exporter TauE/SafE family protein [Actinomycetes bacterium]
MDLEFWWLFPISIVIAATANGAGIGGATFFSPLFVIVLGLDPVIAIGAALLTEVFGFASGVVAHARARAIDWLAVRRLVIVSVPLAVIGSLLADVAPETLLKLLLGFGLFFIAVTFIRHHDAAKEDAEIALGIGVVQPAIRRHIVMADSTVYDYELCRLHEGRIGAGIGGLLVGLISTGLGEANSYSLVQRCRIPSRVAIAVSVVTVAVTALAASVTHLINFIQTPDADVALIASIVVFTIPGVIIGGQLGPQITGRVPERTLIRSIGWLFVAVAAITVWEALR